MALEGVVGDADRLRDFDHCHLSRSSVADFTHPINVEYGDRLHISYSPQS